MQPKIVRRRRGASLLEAMLMMIVVVVGLAGAIYAAISIMDASRASRVAAMVGEVRQAAGSYVTAYRDELRQATAGGVVTIRAARTLPNGPIPDGPAGTTLPSLQGAGFLRSGFVDGNPYGQTHVVAIRSVGATDRLEAVVYTIGGREIADASLGGVASKVGPTGGFMAMAPLSGMDGIVTGSAGGWATPASEWEAGGFQMQGGRVMASLAVDDGVLVDDYLHRVDIGVEEANTMRTHLRMGNNDIQDARNIEIGQDARIGGSITAGDTLQVAGAATAGRDVIAGESMAVGGSAAIAGQMRVGQNALVAGNATAGNATARGGLSAPFLADRKQPTFRLDPSGTSRLNEVSSERLSADAMVYGASREAALGDFLRHDVRVVKTVGILTPNVSSATAWCPAGYRRAMCSGARQEHLLATCAESKCGLIGALPVVESAGNPASRQGCQVAIDGDVGTRAVAVAYCLSNVAGGYVAQTPSFNGGIPGTGGGGSTSEQCPEWAPGVFPNCVLETAQGPCPPWAPGTYPNCRISRCPVWADGTFPNCSFDFAKSANGCALPWGGTIPHGQSVTAYDRSTVPFGSQCAGQVRTCHNGTLTGTWTIGSCSAEQPASCALPWGGSIAHGQSATGYLAASVPFGSVCSGQQRSCWNGMLSGSSAYNVGSCGAQQPASCALPWGGAIAHGQSVTAYAQASVPFGSSCGGQVRTCQNGTLSGSEANRLNTCSTQAPASCALPWGGTIPHGESLAAYAAPSVPHGQSCRVESRACFNGTLNGSFGHSACSVQPPAQPTHWAAWTGSWGFGMIARSCHQTYVPQCPAISRIPVNSPFIDALDLLQVSPIGVNGTSWAPPIQAGINHEIQCTVIPAGSGGWRDFQQFCSGFNF